MARSHDNDLSKDLRKGSVNLSIVIELTNILANIMCVGIPIVFDSTRGSPTSASPCKRQSVLLCFSTHAQKSDG